MDILEKARGICFDISSCYGLGKYTGGAVLASLLAIPLLLISRVIMMVAPWQGYVQLLIFLGISFIIIQLAIKTPAAEYQVYGEEAPVARSMIVLDKIVGERVKWTSTFPEFWTEFMKLEEALEGLKGC